MRSVIEPGIEPVIEIDNRFATTNNFKVAIDLKIKLQPELNNAWFISRSETGKLVCRSTRGSRNANIRKSQLIEEERAVGQIIHLFEVGSVEDIESVEDQLEVERIVGVEANPPSKSQISGKEPRPEAGVSSNCERTVVVIAIEIDIEPRLDIEGESAARGDDRRQVEIGERILVELSPRGRERVDHVAYLVTLAEADRVTEIVGDDCQMVAMI